MKTLSRFLKPSLAAIFIFSAMQLACAAPADQAVSLKGYRVVPIKNGITPFNFGTHDGKTAAKKIPGYIVVSHRENFNAHGFDVISFHAYEPDNRQKTLGLVSIFAEGDKEQYDVDVSGGADCVLHDFRLLESGRGKSPLLIVADREPGETFVDPAGVTFHYYELRENTDGIPGEPYLYFQQVETHKSTRNYCDVRDAFKSELKLGPYNDSTQ